MSNLIDILSNPIFAAVLSFLGIYLTIRFRTKYNAIYTINASYFDAPDQYFNDRTARYLGTRDTDCDRSEMLVLWNPGPASLLRADLRPVLRILVGVSSKDYYSHPFRVTVLGSTEKIRPKMMAEELKDPEKINPPPWVCFTVELVSPLRPGDAIALMICTKKEVRPDIAIEVDAPIFNKNAKYSHRKSRIFKKVFTFTSITIFISAFVLIMSVGVIWIVTDLGGIIPLNLGINEFFASKTERFYLLMFGMLLLCVSYVMMRVEQHNSYKWSFGLPANIANLFMRRPSFLDNN